MCSSVMWNELRLGIWGRTGDAYGGCGRSAELIINSHAYIGKAIFKTLVIPFLQPILNINYLSQLSLSLSMLSLSPCSPSL